MALLAVLLPECPSPAKSISDFSKMPNLGGGMLSSNSGHHLIRRAAGFALLRVGCCPPTQLDNQQVQESLMGPKFWSKLAPAAALFAFTLTAAAQNFEVKSHTLKNGMKVLVQEDRSIPNVALYVFYRIGSRNEHTGATGLSHFFEHMMFNGAKKYGPGDFDHTME